jgi:hypothetical protein
VAYVPDLMDRSKVAAAAPGAVFVGSPADLAARAAEADLVVVDLGRPGVLDALADLGGVRTIGFASHVAGDVIAAAQTAGCDEVLPRSRFFAQVADLLG